MKKSIILLSTLCLLGFVSCNNKTSSGQSTSESSSQEVSSSESTYSSQELDSKYENLADEYQSIAKQYGKIKVESKLGNNFSIDEANHIITLNQIDTYTFTGYFNGTVQYELEDSAAKSQTGIIELNQCFIFSNEKNAINWTSSKGTLELHSNTDTENYLISNGIDGEKVQTIKGNNLDFRGKGKLTVQSYNHNAIKGQDVDFKSTKLTIKAKKNGISCENATFKSGNISIEALSSAVVCECKTLSDNTKDQETGNLICNKKDEGETLNINIEGGKYAFDVENTLLFNFGTINANNCSSGFTTNEHYTIQNEAVCNYNGEALITK